MFRLLVLIILFAKCPDRPGQKAVFETPDVSQTPVKPMAVTKQFEWKDKRPICAMFLGSYKANPLPGNPRNWKIDGIENFDIKNNLKGFQQAVLNHATNSVSALKEMNAQGMVLWDLEGEEYFHPVTYIGDPSMFAQTAPEMANIADKFFKIFTDAGLRVGVCIRPDTTTFFAKGKHYWHEAVVNPAATLIRKIQYAKKRWGCTLFYVDSNVYPDPIYGQLMHDSIFRKVNEAFPDCLIMPEHENQEYYKYCAPYQQLTSFRSTLTVEKEQNPNAFMVLYVPDGFAALNDQAKVNALQETMAQGNIIMFRNWYADPINLQIKKAWKNMKSSNPGSKQ